MRYTLIVPAWNEAAFIGPTLTALQAAMAGVSGHTGELVVVDNNSTDDTAQVATASGARVVFEPVNQIARARNAGARAANGEALIFVDADTVAAAELLQAALDRLASGRVVGGGATLAPDKPVTGMASFGLEFWNTIGRAAKLAAGCFVYVRRDAFDAIGGFSEQVYAGEEIFLSRRLKRYARQHAMRFDIIPAPPVVTSVRKLDWYTPGQLARQAALVLIPGAIYSKTLCRTWYDGRGNRTKRLPDSAPRSPHDMACAPLSAISSMATKALLADLLANLPGHADAAVHIESVGGVDAARRIGQGEAFDVVFLASGAIDRLIEAGHLQSQRVDLFRSPVAVAVQHRAARPAIDSEAALRQAVLAADTIGYSTGPSGAHLVNLFRRWGIAQQIDSRTVVAPPGVPVASLVASGEVALGFQQLSELLDAEGIALLGTLPPDCAFITTFSAGLGASSTNTRAAQQLLRALASPASHAIIRRHGMEPVLQTDHGDPT